MRTSKSLLLLPLAVVVAFLVAGGCIDTGVKETAQAGREAAETAVMIEPPFVDELDPEEDGNIEAALLAQGYYRDDVPLDYSLQDNLHTACETYGIPYEVALGLIETESRFKLDADNGKCYGLCQLNRKYFPDNLTPRENIWAGMEYLGKQLERYGNIEAALTAFNAGHDTGNRAYAKAVIQRAEAWATKE